MLLHDRRIDPIWKIDAGSKECKAARHRVYHFLSEKLGIPREEVHTGLFDIERCRAAWRALSDKSGKRITYADLSLNRSNEPKGQ